MMVLPGRKLKKLSVEETYQLYEQYRHAMGWANNVRKINTALPKHKAKYFDSLQETADTVLQDIEERVAEAIDRLPETELDKFKEKYGI